MEQILHNVMERDWDELTLVVDQARTKAKEHALSERAVYILCLVLEEILANAIMHEKSAPEGVSVTLFATDQGLRLEFVDKSGEFDPTAAPLPPTGSVADLQQGGFGLHLVNSMANAVSYEHRDGVNTLVVDIANEE